MPGSKVVMKDGEVLEAQYKVDFVEPSSLMRKLAAIAIETATRIASAVRPLDEEAIAVRLRYNEAGIELMVVKSPAVVLSR